MELNLSSLGSRLFSNENVNKGRQLELDIARGLAVLFMVLVHVQIEFLAPEVSESWIGWAINFLGTPPAAPVFMFMLGAFIIYSSKNDPRTLIRRGFLLLLAGYLLNFFRGTLPDLTAWAMNGGSGYIDLASNALIEIDILQFAGLAFIFFGIARKYKWNNRTIVGTALVLSLLSYYLNDYTAEDYSLKAITGLFWGSSAVSYFPFVSWILVPVLGYVFGQYLVRCKDKELFYRTLLLLSVLVLAAMACVSFAGLTIDIGLTDDYVYYHMDTVANAAYISFAVFWMAILFYATKYVPKVVAKTIGRWSRNVTDIYIIHWIFIGWIAIVIGRHGLELGPYMVLFISIFIVSDALAWWYGKAIKKRGAKAVKG